MTRTEQINAMSEEAKRADLLSSLKEFGCVRIATRAALGVWGAAVDSLVQQGLVKCEHIENYEGQYSYFKLELTDLGSDEKAV